MVPKTRVGLERTDRVQPTPQGGAYVDAVISRVGVLEYVQPNGTIRRELRPAEEVLSPASVASYRDAPVTVDHPPANVTPETWRKHSVGHVSAEVGATNIMQAADKPPIEALSARLVIQDGAALRQVQAGMLLELSPGYTVELDETPGYDPRFGAYDAVQRNIRCNHIALLPPGMGRQGEGVSLRLDRKGNVVLQSDKGVRMDEDAVKELVAGMLPNMDELVAKVSEQVSTALPDLIKGLMTEAMSEGSTPAAPADPAEAEDAEDELPMEEKEDELPMDERYDARVRARLETMRLYERVVGKEADLAKSDHELLSEAVIQCGGDVRKDAKDFELKAWIEGRLSLPVLKTGVDRKDSTKVDWDNPKDVLSYIDRLGDEQ